MKYHLPDIVITPSVDRDCSRKIYIHLSGACFLTRSWERVQIRRRVFCRGGCHRGAVCALFSDTDDAQKPSLHASEVLQKSNLLCALKKLKNSLTSPSTKLHLIEPSRFTCGNESRNSRPPIKWLVPLLVKEYVLLSFLQFRRRINMCLPSSLLDGQICHIIGACTPRLIKFTLPSRRGPLSPFKDHLSSRSFGHS